MVRRLQYPANVAPVYVEIETAFGSTPVFQHSRKQVQFQGSFEPLLDVPIETVFGYSTIISKTQIQFQSIIPDAAILGATGVKGVGTYIPQWRRRRR